MITPLVSIAMTSFNGGLFLKEQLDSIINQTYRNIEIIICDDCSNDNTLKILEEYTHVKNITYFVNNTNLGVVKNFEKVLSLCKGEYIALADQDDIWDMNKIQRLYENIGDRLLIHSDAKLIDQNNDLIAASYFRFSHKKLRIKTLEYFFDNDVTGCTALLNKKLLKVALPFPSNVVIHDWWLAICASKNGQIEYLNEPLTAYRQHGHNQIGAADISKVYPHELRVKAYQKTLLFLESLYNEKKWDEKENEVLNDLIIYYHAYFKDTIRIRSFLIHLKYFNLFHNDKSLIYRFFGLFLSLFGEKVQKNLWRTINR